MDYSKMSYGELESLCDDYKEAYDEAIQENDDERASKISDELDLIEEEMALRDKNIDD